MSKTREMTAKRFATSRLSGKSTAEGFLQAHRAFLQGYDFLSPIIQAYDTGELLPTPTLLTIQSALLTHVLENDRLAGEAKLAQRKQQAGKSKLRPTSDMELPAKEVSPPAYTITLMCKLYTPENERLLKAHADASDVPFTIGVGLITDIVGYKIRTPQGDVIVDTKNEADGHILLETLTETRPAVYEADDYGAAQRLADRRLFQREDSVYAIIVNNYDRPIETNIMRGDAIARMMPRNKGPATRRTTATSSTLKWQGKAKQDRSSFSKG